MKKLMASFLTVVAVIGIVSLLASTPADAAKGTCANVRCAACPDGYHLLLKWPTCCACVKN
jgi:hypothetical protein